MGEKELALEHIGKIRSGIRAIEAHAKATGDETLKGLAGQLHRDAASARAAYLEERGWTGDQGDFGDGDGDSGGEDKPKEPGG